MKCWFLLLLITLISCKRNHTSVLVKAVDEDTGAPINNAKVEVIRKGKKNVISDQEHLLIQEGNTNSAGEVLINFKYERGNKYALFVYPSNGYFQNTRYQYFDLEKGKNEETAYMHQSTYFKMNFKSNSPSDKFLLSVEIEDVTNTGILYGIFNHYSTPIDSTIFRMINIGRGIKNIIWKVDSAGFERDYSLPIEFKGHDTTYAIINF